MRVPVAVSADKRSLSKKAGRWKWWSLAWLLPVLLTSPACNRQSINCGVECTQPPNEKLFNFGFEGVTIQQAGNSAYISGTDTAYPDHNQWDAFRDNPDGTLSIYYEDGDLSQRRAAVVPAPDNPENHVLLFEIAEPNVKKGRRKKARVQMQFHQTRCIQEYYQTCRLYLPKASMEYLTQYPEPIHWLTLFEFWNNANWTREKHPFRIAVGLWKAAGVGQSLFFHVKAEVDKSLGGFDPIWEEVNERAPLLFDRWLTITLYVREGDADHGRFYMAVTPDGGQKQVLFDIRNFTQHPKETCPDGYTHIHPMKLYTSDAVVNHMKAGGRKLQVYWDDWVVYRNKKP